MKENIETILKELFAIDPTLKAHEEKLRVIIQDIIKARPHVVFDESFKQELKQHLLAHAATMQKPIRQKNRLLTLAPVLLGAIAIIALVAIGVFNQPKTNPWNVDIIPTQERAFNILSQTSPASTDINTLGMGGTESAPNAPTPLGVGAGGGITKSGTRPSDIPAVDVFKYVYKGDDFSVDQSSLAVLKKVRSPNIDTQIKTIIQSLGLGLVDLKTFSNPTIESVSLTESGNFGYSINIDLNGGSIAFYQNWQQAPGPTTPSTYTPRTPDSLPSNQDVARIAQDFISQHNIKTNAYGDPEIINDWRQIYAQTENKSQVYIPDGVEVVFPLKINDQYVYDESGNKTGISATINADSHRVSSLWGLATQTYQSSLYSTIQDTNAIIALAQEGGIRKLYSEGLDYESPNTNIIEVPLGTPQRGYLKAWIPTDNVSEELIVPSLIFPILQAPSNQPFYQKAIVVPLIKDVIDRFQNQPPVITPMMKE